MGWGTDFNVNVDVDVKFRNPFKYLRRVGLAKEILYDHLFVMLVSDPRDLVPKSNLPRAYVIYEQMADIFDKIEKLIKEEVIVNAYVSQGVGTEIPHITFAQLLEGTIFKRKIPICVYANRKSEAELADLETESSERINGILKHLVSFAIGRPVPILYDGEMMNWNDYILEYVINENIENLEEHTRNKVLGQLFRS